MAFCFKVFYFVKIWWEWLRAWTSDKFEHPASKVILAPCMHGRVGRGLREPDNDAFKAAMHKHE